MRISPTSKKKVLQNAVLLAILVYFLFLLFSQQPTLDRNLAEYEEIRYKTEQMKEENKALEDELSMADSDEYLERKAREVTGYVRPDEIVFVEKT